MPNHCQFFITDSQTGMFLSGFDPETGQPTWSSNQNDAYCFETEQQMQTILDFMNQGGSRFVGHRPPKP